MITSGHENLEKAEKRKTDGIGWMHLLGKHKLPKLTGENVETVIDQSHKRKCKGSKISDLKIDTNQNTVKMK